MIMHCHQEMAHEHDAICVAGCLQALHYLVDLLQDENPEVVAAADAALDMLQEAGGPVAEAVQALKFEAYNAEWLQTLGGSGGAALHPTGPEEA
jgi:hypothetical protein